LIRLPLIAGIAAAIILVALFSIFYFSPSSPFKQPSGGDNTTLRKPPKMIMQTYDGTEYVGGLGSYCWVNDGCADSSLEFFTPTETVSIQKGKPVQFRVQDYRQPDSIYVEYFNSKYRAVESLKPEEITQRMNTTGYVVDIPEGDYILALGAAWHDPDTKMNYDAAYGFRVRVS
jgi:hypothetical protein